jgi:hypothetical protein
VVVLLSKQRALAVGEEFTRGMTARLAETITRQAGSRLQTQTELWLMTEGTSERAREPMGTKSIGHPKVPSLALA